VQTNKYTSKTVYFNLEKDADLLKIVERVDNFSAFVKDLIREKYGLTSNSQQEDIDQGFIKTIQLERAFKELSQLFLALCWD